MPVVSADIAGDSSSAKVKEFRLEEQVQAVVAVGIELEHQLPAVSGAEARTRAPDARACVALE